MVVAAVVGKMQVLSLYMNLTRFLWMTRRGCNNSHCTCFVMTSYLNIPYTVYLTFSSPNNCFYGCLLFCFVRSRYRVLCHCMADIYIYWQRAHSRLYLIRNFGNCCDAHVWCTLEVASKINNIILFIFKYKKKTKQNKNLTN